MGTEFCKEDCRFCENNNPNNNIIEENLNSSHIKNAQILHKIHYKNFSELYISHSSFEKTATKANKKLINEYTLIQFNRIILLVLKRKIWKILKSKKKKIYKKEEIDNFKLNNLNQDNVTQLNHLPIVNSNVKKFNSNKSIIKPKFLNNENLKNKGKDETKLKMKIVQYFNNLIINDTNNSFSTPKSANVNINKNKNKNINNVKEDNICISNKESKNNIIYISSTKAFSFKNFNNSLNPSKNTSNNSLFFTLNEHKNIKNINNKENKHSLFKQNNNINSKNININQQDVTLSDKKEQDQELKSKFLEMQKQYTKRNSVNLYLNKNEQLIRNNMMFNYDYYYKRERKKKKNEALDKKNKTRKSLKLISKETSQKNLKSNINLVSLNKQLNKLESDKTFGENKENSAENNKSINIDLLISSPLKNADDSFKSSSVSSSSGNSNEIIKKTKTYHRKISELKEIRNMKDVNDKESDNKIIQLVDSDSNSSKKMISHIYNKSSSKSNKENNEDKSNKKEQSKRNSKNSVKKKISRKSMLLNNDDINTNKSYMNKLKLNRSKSTRKNKLSKCKSFSNFSIKILTKYNLTLKINNNKINKSTINPFIRPLLSSKIPIQRNSDLRKQLLENPNENKPNVSSKPSLKEIKSELLKKIVKQRRKTSYKKMEFLNNDKNMIIDFFKNKNLTNYNNDLNVSRNKDKSFDKFSVSNINFANESKKTSSFQKNYTDNLSISEPDYN